MMANERGAWRPLVQQAVGRIREIEASGPLSRALLERIRAELIPLGDHPECFSDEEFPPPSSGQGDRLYCLSVDDDGGQALYLIKCGDHKDTPPHNHTTWAVVVGVEGREHNRFYERRDDGGEPGRAQLRQSGEATVERGTGVCMMPDDIHSIHMRGAETKTMLHMYGRALTEQKERIEFDMESGAYKVFRPHPDITMMA